MALDCINCGNGIRQGSAAELCLACRARLTHCKIGARKHIKEEKGFKIQVEWCTEKDKRIINVNCKDCKHYSEDKILPEVK